MKGLRPSARLLLGLLLGSAGCDARLTQAVEAFLSFSESLQAPSSEEAGEAAPAREVRLASRRVLPGVREVLLLDLQGPLQMDAGEVRRALEGAARGPEGAGAPVVVARLWPGRLRHVVGPYGTYVLARDGRGLGEAPFGEWLWVADRLGGRWSLADIERLSALDAALGRGERADEAIARVSLAKGLTVRQVALLWARARSELPAPLPRGRLVPPRPSDGPPTR
ncbi:MAG: hypothetical protein D6729_07510 [Deltaproteobacteria bacterium]|nr:MAG: hypothetical protein D6729_07510 [Deltaproteobacteria bacterium]